MKFTLSSVLAILVFMAPLGAWGAYNDVTLTTDTVLSVGGITVNISGSSAVVESIVVNTSSFNVTLLPSSTITVTTPNKEELNANVETYTTTNSCSTLTLTGSGASATVTITPDSADICSTSGGGGGGGGSKKKNPGSSTTTTSPPSSTPGSTTTTTTTTTNASFNRDLTIGSTGSDVIALQEWLIAKGFAIAAGATGYFGGQTQAALARYQASVGIVPAAGYFGPLTRARIQGSTTGTTGQVTPATPATPAASGAFARDLTVGSSGEDVRALQVYLNTNGASIAVSGVGSPGNETNLFGALTKAALMRFQTSVGLSPAVGYFGSLTRAYIEAHP